jgi:hypothetical protein
MTTLTGILVLALPFAALAALLLLVERHRRHRAAEIQRQIALTDALHARMGALVAPVVRGRPRAWRVAVAVPVEQPDVVAAVLDMVEQTFGREGYEVVLSRQVASGRSRPTRPAVLGRESLSWT